MTRADRPDPGERDKTTMTDRAQIEQDDFPRIEIRLPRLTPAEAWMVYEVAEAFVTAFWRRYQDDIIDQLIANGALPGFDRRPEPPAEPRPATKGHDLRLLQLIAEMEDPHIPLVFIPDLVASSGVSIDVALRALADLSAQGQLELRPDSGVGLLKPDEASVCPKGIDGTPLTYCRRIPKRPPRR